MANASTAISWMAANTLRPNTQLNKSIVYFAPVMAGIAYKTAVPDRQTVIQMWREQHLSTTGAKAAFSNHGKLRSREKPIKEREKFSLRRINGRNLTCNPYGKPCKKYNPNRIASLELRFMIQKSPQHAIHLVLVLVPVSSRVCDGPILVPRAQRFS